MTATDRAEGALLGLACGDALGRPVEFRSPRRIEREYGRLDEMVGDGAHRKPPGTITDDTELALRIARSLVETGTFDGADIAEGFVEWYRSGPFDIGGLTADALRLIDQGHAWDEAGQTCWEARPEGQNAGNGSVMRCAPHAFAFDDDESALVTASTASSRITHADPRCTYGCAVLNLTIANCLDEYERPLAAALETVRADAPDELVDALEPIVAGAEPEPLSNSGYVVHTLQTALYEAFTAEEASEAIVAAVNRGGDADTLGAVAGAVAGARFGASSLPPAWLDAIDETDELRDLARELFQRTYTPASS
jgi:ADP-ribosyl-[dinitrogen reductase] hydrolase